MVLARDGFLKIHWDVVPSNFAPSTSVFEFQSTSLSQLSKHNLGTPPPLLLLSPPDWRRLVLPGRLFFPSWLGTSFLDTCYAITSFLLPPAAHCTCDWPSSLEYHNLLEWAIQPIPIAKLVQIFIRVLSHYPLFAKLKIDEQWSNRALFWVIDYQDLVLSTKALEIYIFLCKPCSTVCNTPIPSRGSQTAKNKSSSSKYNGCNHPEACFWSELPLLSFLQRFRSQLPSFWTFPPSCGHPAEPFCQNGFFLVGCCPIDWHSL